MHVRRGVDRDAYDGEVEEYGLYFPPLVCTHHALNTHTHTLTVHIQTHVHRDFLLPRGS